MDYFVTGGTGFIGRYLIGKLLERDGQIHVLVREGSRGKLEEMRAGFGDEGDKIVPVIGDLSQPMLGVSEPEIEALKGKIGHFFHLAAIYDMEADAEEMRVANVEGTIHAVDLGTGVTFADLPADFLEALCDDIVAKRATAPIAGSPDIDICPTDLEGLSWKLPGSEATAPITVTGPLAACTAYLAGRGDSHLGASRDDHTTTIPSLAAWL